MIKKDIHRREALLRSVEFLKNHPSLQENARLGVVRTEMQTALAEVDQLHTDQISGRGFARGGVAETRRVEKELRRWLRLVADIGKVLDPMAFPGVSQQLRMPRFSYPELEARTRVFLEVVAPIKAAFVERMLPADFDLTLQRLLADFLQARARKRTGHAEQLNGTAGAAESIRRAMRLLREADAMVNVALMNDPASLAAWKGAVRIQRSRSAQEPPTDAPTLPETMHASAGAEKHAEIPALPQRPGSVITSLFPQSGSLHWPPPLWTADVDRHRPSEISPSYLL